VAENPDRWLRSVSPGERPSTTLTSGNKVQFFTDNVALYSQMLIDIGATGAPDSFVYMANWWLDVEIGLGDPSKQPPTLRQTLMAAAKPRRVAVPLQSGTKVQPGAQVCALAWAATVQYFAIKKPVTINAEAVKFINSLDGLWPELADFGTEPGYSQAIYDGRTEAFGSHHQKVMLVGSNGEVVAHVSSTDLNADRIYEFGSRLAAHPPETRGCPLNDVGLRIAGPAAWCVLGTFRERWYAHPDSRVKLRGDTYRQSARTEGEFTVQINRTYGRGYPFPAQETTAADAVLTVISAARKYLYFEDQYLVGNPELRQALLASLSQQRELVVIGVMAPGEIAGDLPQLIQRRKDFWLGLQAAYPERVKIFESLGRDRTPNGPNAYLHAKTTLADDEVAIVGTVNFSARSFFHDSEISATVVHSVQPHAGTQTLAARLRQVRWAQHLNIDEAKTRDLRAAFLEWDRIGPTSRVRRWTPPTVPAGAIFSLGRPLTSLEEDIAWKLVLDPGERVGARISPAAER
jgi:phosphatidylserine/phosphatidylglycerophosphate/cardiolipin synthase-like enzyme